MRSISIAFVYFSQFMKMRLSHRADLIADLFATALSSLFAFSFVLLLFVPIDSIAGWKRDEIIFIYGFSLVPYGLFAMVSWNLYDFGSRFIVDAAFDRVLLRPVNSFLQVICESFRIQALAEAALGIVVMIHAAHELRLEFSFFDLVWIGFSFLCGTVIFIAVFGALCAISFFAEDRVGIAPPVFNLINPARYPPDLFDPAIRFMLRFVIPFHFVAFYPATLVLRRGEFVEMCRWTPLAALACVGVLAVVWRIGVRNYSSTGS